MTRVRDLGVGFGGWRRTGIEFGTALLLVLLLACGGEEAPSPADTTPPAPAATPEPASPPAAAMPSRDVEIATGELPKDYPADLPQPPSAAPQTSMLVPGQGGLITFTSSETSEAVVDHFKKTLPEQGWDVAGVTDEPTRSLIKATKDTRAVDVSVRNSPTGDGTIVVVLVKPN